MCYKDIYDFAIKSLDDEQSRATRIDNKSSIYITLISIMLGAFGVSWQWIFKEIIPPSTNLEYAAVIVGAFLFISLCVTLILLSICLAQSSIKHLRTEYEKFYEIADTQSSDIYYLTVAASVKEPLKDAINNVNKKALRLHNSYISLIVNFSFLVLFILIIGFQGYIVKKSEVETKSVNISIHADKIILKGTIDDE